MGNTYILPILGPRMCETWDCLKTSEVLVEIIIIIVFTWRSNFIRNITRSALHRVPFHGMTDVILIGPHPSLHIFFPNDEVDILEAFKGILKTLKETGPLGLTYSICKTSFWCSVHMVGSNLLRKKTMWQVDQKICYSTSRHRCVKMEFGEYAVQYIAISSLGNQSV